MATHGRVFHEYYHRIKKDRTIYNTTLLRTGAADFYHSGIF